MTVLRGKRKAAGVTHPSPPTLARYRASRHPLSFPPRGGWRDVLYAGGVPPPPPFPSLGRREHLRARPVASQWPRGDGALS
jgi:hypothetical protein